MMQAKPNGRKPARVPATPAQAAGCCGPLDRLLDPAFFKALCDPTRALLVGCIGKCGRGCSVGEVAECCSVDVSVVSRHLANLERAGVLRSEKQGRIVRYAVRYAEIAANLRALATELERCCPIQPGGRAPKEKGGCCDAR
jgi:ArsR family transcriptional regulator